MFLQTLIKSRTFLLLAFCLVLTVLHAQAQIVFDNASSNGAFSNTGIANLNVSHTVGIGVDRILYVGVST